MKKIITYMVVCICIITSVASCKKSAIPPKKPTDSTGTKTGTITGTPGTADVYVAGYEENSQSQLVAVYWKNGIEVKLPGGESTNCRGMAICVSGNDVYVAGSSGTQAVYWKNGVQIGVSSGMDTLRATSICVANGNVYVGVSQPFLYEAQKLYPAYYVVVSSTGGQTKHGLGVVEQTQATGIAVSGTDVYSSGSTGKAGGVAFSVKYFLPQAYYWKNAAPEMLPFNSYMNNIALTTPDIINSSANSIAVSGNDVYTAGAVGVSYPDDNEGDYTTSPAYWKNGTPYMLAEQTVANNIQTFPLGFATSIYLAGPDVYISGTVYENTNNAACYWKNNSSTIFMPRQGDYAAGNGISVSGNDVYMVGTDYKDNPETSTACYWKNGTETTLSTSPYSEGKGIFVVTH